MKSMKNIEITWEAPEFEHRERNLSWYWTSIALAAAIIAFAVFQKNFLFGLFIVVAEILIIVWGDRMPRMVSFSLSEKGIEIENEKIRLFSEMESFSIDESPKDGLWDVLVFHFHGKFKLPLIVHLPKEKLEEIRSSIKKTLKEIDYEPSFLDSLEKLIGF